MKTLYESLLKNAHGGMQWGSLFKDVLYKPKSWDDKVLISEQTFSRLWNRILSNVDYTQHVQDCLKAINKKYNPSFIYTWAPDDIQYFKECLSKEWKVEPVSPKEISKCYATNSTVSCHPNCFIKLTPKQDIEGITCMYVSFLQQHRRQIQILQEIRVYCKDEYAEFEVDYTI